MSWEDFSPHRRDFVEDPLPAYRWLRDHAPAFHVAAEDIWVLSRYDDVVAGGARLALVLPDRERRVPAREGPAARSPPSTRRTTPSCAASPRRVRTRGRSRHGGAR